MAAFVWSLILHTYFVGQLPDWLHLAFRQPQCFSSIALVLWFAPVRPEDEDQLFAKGLLIVYVRFDITNLRNAELTKTGADDILGGSVDARGSVGAARAKVPRSSRRAATAAQADLPEAVVSLGAQEAHVEGRPGRVPARQARQGTTLR